MNKLLQSILVPTLFVFLGFTFFSSALADYCDEYEYVDHCYRLDDFDSLPDGYIVDPENPVNGDIYYGYCKVRCADADTFTSITLEGRENFYGKDKDHVFYMMNRLNGIDPDTFKTKKIGSQILVYDEDTFFLDGRVFTDPPDPEILEIEGFIRDKDHVYIEKPIEGIPEDSFLPNPLKYRYEIDEKAHPAYYTTGYNITDEAVYWKGKKIEEADAGSFEVMHDAFAKDKNNVYSDGKVIYGADTKSFQEADIEGIEIYIYIDKYRSYFGAGLKKISEIKKDIPESKKSLNATIKSALLEYKEKYPGYTPQPAIDPDNPPKFPLLGKWHDWLTDMRYLNPPAYYGILTSPFVIVVGLVAFVIWRKKNHKS